MTTAIATSANATHPVAAPPMTSVNQCGRRYTRLMGMSTASTTPTTMGHRVLRSAGMLRVAMTPMTTHTMP